MLADEMAEAAGGVLVCKDKPGRVLGDGELRLVEVLRVRLSTSSDAYSSPC